MSAPVASDSAAQIARYDNSLIGLASGDAWGFQVEFRKYADMPAYPPPCGSWAQVFAPGVRSSVSFSVNSSTTVARRRGTSGLPGRSSDGPSDSERSWFSVAVLLPGRSSVLSSTV